jgi:hypothetical protein
MLRTINWEAPILAGTGQDRSLAHSGASEPMSLALTAPRIWQIKEARQSISLAEELGQTSANITQFDAAVGHTYGISLNQTTRAGTNDLHGGIRYRRYDLRWFAMQHIQGVTYQARMTANNCAANPTSAACQLAQEQLGWPGTNLNYGDAGIGGPVFIPKLFDGRNRLFFFVGVTDSAPNNASSNTIAVPRGLEKTGNFSDLGPGAVPTGAVATLFRAAGCPAGTPFYGQYQIYNPYSVTMVNGHPSRLPFCGNIIPANLISRLPVVQTVNSYLPDPNSSSTTGNNFIYEQGTLRQLPLRHKSLRLCGQQRRSYFLPMDPCALHTAKHEFPGEQLWIL